jgi:hypothetical protein
LEVSMPYRVAVGVLAYGGQHTGLLTLALE